MKYKTLRFSSLISTNILQQAIMALREHDVSGAMISRSGMIDKVGIADSPNIRIAESEAIILAKTYFGEEIQQKIYNFQGKTHTKLPATVAFFRAVITTNYKWEEYVVILVFPKRAGVRKIEEEFIRQIEDQIELSKRKFDN